MTDSTADSLPLRFLTWRHYGSACTRRSPHSRAQQACIACDNVHSRAASRLWSLLCRLNLSFQHKLDSTVLNCSEPHRTGPAGPT